MILAVDVGNTNIVLGCIENGDIQSIFRISTDEEKTTHEYAFMFKSILELNGYSCTSFDDAIVSSVVLPITSKVQKAIQILIGRKPFVVGAGIKTGLEIRIDNPAQLGSDMVVAAVAALQDFNPPLVVIDMGTATTFSAIDAKGAFVGAIIYPGVKLAFRALSNGTSQLPQISIEAPKRVIGTNTLDSMRSGGIFCTASMIDGMIERIEEEFGEKVTVVSTGGLSKFVVPYCKREVINDENLLLKGLWILYEKNKKK